MKILVDVNLKGHAALLFATLQEEGWVELFDLSFVYFSATPLEDDSDDATVWRYAQAQHALLLTDNRNRQGAASLQATLERENHPQALPVLTVGNKERLNNADYRVRVAEGIADVMLYLDNFRGTGRVFLP
jgi:predicted nuclease of predicted toxin-antitoxin system